LAKNHICPNGVDLTQKSLT